MFAYVRWLGDHGKTLLGLVEPETIDFERPAVERLICSGELDVGLRDFDDDVLIGEVKTYRLELDVDFEIWTVLTDECFSS